MKHFFTTIIIASFILPSVAQEDVDQATIRCYYRFSQKKKTGETAVQDTMTLDIGSQMSRYYDGSKLQRDSAFRSILHNLRPESITSVSILKNVNPNSPPARSSGNTHKNSAYDGISEQIFKNRKNGNIVMLNVSTEPYKGTDPVGVLDWTISPETIDFLDYTCQKATLKFRGRNYEAWFTPQIPINDGPWKFFGLPGLILKVRDTEGLFDFECIGLENLNTPYTVEIPKGTYFECNRKDYNNVVSKIGGGQSINISGGDVIISNFIADTSFLQIELD